MNTKIEDRRSARFMLETFIFFSIISLIVIAFTFQLGRQYEREHPSNEKSWSWLVK